MNAHLHSYRRAREIAAYTFKLSQSRTQRKHILRWLHSLQHDYLINEPSPWIVFDAIDFISRRIDSKWKVFEYGSGGSTLFWLSKGASCVSIEHDAAWYQILKSRLLSEANVDYRFIPPIPLDTDTAQQDFDASDPDKYLSTDDYRGYSFKDYVNVINEFPHNHFDLILIDGRARPSCIKHSLPKLKSSGLLVVDNADRKYYLEKTETLLGKFLKHEFVGVTPTLSFYTQTNIYEKPDS